MSFESVLPADLGEVFSRGDLVAAIAQDVANGEVLMMAWMSRESLELTIRNKRATYWSRSRGTLWVKGETSGHFQNVISISFDCDADALLLKVEQVGAACHTGDRSCFHREIKLA
jgi:phosphoribosyl-AMP cyclohydrolase